MPQTIPIPTLPDTIAIHLLCHILYHYLYYATYYTTTYIMPHTIALPILYHILYHYLYYATYYSFSFNDNSTHLLKYIDSARKRLEQWDIISIVTAIVT